MTPTIEKKTHTFPPPPTQDAIPLEYNQCQEAVKRLTDYLSNELEPTEAKIVQSHLAQCKGCFAKFHFEDALLRTIREKVEHVRAPQTLREKILGLLGPRA
ncbi:MAG: zf-HC2 domain-containing protein [Akkermansiaceae bacterium]|nr:zf-HC2 domain-containing protein [Armatimonadota bacterium]